MSDEVEEGLGVASDVELSHEQLAGYSNYPGAVEVDLMDRNARTFAVEMKPGTYQLQTESGEEITVRGGSLDIRIGGVGEFTRYTTGEKVVVPSRSSFEIRVVRGARYESESRIFQALFGSAGVREEALCAMMGLLTISRW